MNRIAVITLLLMISASFSQPGIIMEGLSLQSEIVPYDVNYCVYLPPQYEESTQRYPVVYLLHGYSDAEWGWVQFGQIKELADDAIASGDIPPMIIVMPDAKVTFYVNNANGKDNYEDMFFQEFIPHIDESYRTRPKKEFRGVAGLSMGGFGALTYAMRHTDTFAACAAYSSAVWTPESLRGDAWNEDILGAVFGRKTGDDYPDYFKKLHPLDLVTSVPADTLNTVRYYIDCGDKDFLVEGNCALHVAMLKNNLEHEFRIREGRHSWEYWRTGIIPGLDFISKSFHR